jgi:hypothetical protein
MSKKRALRRMVALSIILLLVGGCANKSVIGFIGIVLSAICFESVIVAPPVAGALAVAQVLNYVEANSIDQFKGAPANPDPNFTAPAAVVPVHFSLPPSTLFNPNKDAVPPGVNESLEAAGRLIDHTRMVNLSLRKYYGALNANDAASAQLQKGYACLSVTQLNADIQSYSAALASLSQSVQGTPFASVSTTTPEVLRLRDQITQSRSFPASELFVLTQAHATDQEISGAIDQVALVTDQGFTASDLTGAVIISKASEAINGVNVSQFLPDGFSCADAPAVPALPPFGGIVITILLLGAGATLTLWRRARRE